MSELGSTKALQNEVNQVSAHRPFEPVDTQTPFPKAEKEILDHWSQIKAFEKSVEQRPEEDSYVFYDGPPFATGLPHYGHMVASTLKDIVPRYWAMRGRKIERRFGWDTHGLPIEMLMEKELGLSGPTSVKEFEWTGSMKPLRKRSQVHCRVGNIGRTIGSLGRFRQ